MSLKKYKKRFAKLLKTSDTMSMKEIQKDEKKVQVSVRLAPSLVEFLGVSAEEGNRSLSQEIEFRLRKSVQIEMEQKQAERLRLSE